VSSVVVWQRGTRLVVSVLVFEDDKVNTLAEALAALERGWPSISSGRGIEPEDKGCLEAT
jgi:hypothetical protein